MLSVQARKQDHIVWLSYIMWTIVIPRYCMAINKEKQLFYVYNPSWRHRDNMDIAYEELAVLAEALFPLVALVCKSTISCILQPCKSSSEML